VPGDGGPTGGARPPTPTAARLDLRAASTSSDNIFDVGAGQLATAPSHSDGGGFA